MNMKSVKHALAALLVFCMVLTMLPISALAATNVTPQPAQNSAAQIPVEYFTSTLYDWNQKGANNATAEADYKVGREETYLQWSIMPTEYTDLVFYAGYAVKVGNNYYPAYGKYNGDNSYAVYYRTDGATNEYYRDTNGQTLVATYDVPDTNAYITDSTGTLATESVNGTDNVIIFYGADEGGHYESKGFYFTDGNEIPDAFQNLNDKKTYYPAFSKWQGDNQEFSIYSGLAAKDLTASENAPFDNDTVNAADLFGTTEYAWKNVYQNVKVPFYVDDDGYYILNSDKYGVYFTDGVNAAKDGATMAIADQPSCYWAPGNNTRKEVTGFLPFNTLTNQTHNAAPSTSYLDANRVSSYAIVDNTNDGKLDQNQDAVNYGFGMVTEVKFQMTDDGKDANGKDITFEFSGDDDVWVYIDNKLVLDVGGTHDAIKGTINFVTGVVELTAPAYGKIGDIAKTANKQPTANGDGATLQQTNLYGDNGALGTTLTGFSAQGEHTMKIFYMERGRGRTNCLIKFNLPQRDTVEVTKKLDHAMSDEKVLSDLSSAEKESLNSREFGFTLFEDGKAVANKTCYVYDSDNNLLRTASTNAAGHFTLHRNETARFLVDIGTNNSFYVVEDTMTKDADGFLTPTWTYTTNVTGAQVTKEADGFTGMTVTATGTYDGTKTDTISFVCENYLSSNIPNPGIYPQGERIVIDYGLPITINVSDLLKNDIIRGDETTVSLIDAGGVYGNAVYNDVGNDGDYTNDTITYTLNKQLTGIETLTYQITVTGSGNTGSEQTSETATATANVQIMPATSMYYEENFGGPGVVMTEGNPYVVYSLVSYSNGDTKWTAQGTANGGNQETGFVGTIGDSTYGSDAVYLDGIGDSYGTSMKASAPADGKAALFEYDFTGTGTAIYGRVNAKTGYIRVVITNNKNEEVDRQFIDTVELADVGSASELYNVPIYLNNTFAHGDYHVEVMLYKAGTPTGQGKNTSGPDFYLDGIRIYNPVVNNATVNTAYADDGEANTVVLNIRDKIVGDEEDGYLGADFFTLTDVNGNVITGGDDITGDSATVTDYAAYGPNNEFYLNNPATGNQAYTVSFKLINWDAQLYKMYLGMKAPAGNATVTVGGTDISLENSTDCYYDISDYVKVASEDVTVYLVGADGNNLSDDNGDPITVTKQLNVGTVTISGNTGLVSLTNVKITGVDEFELGTYTEYQKEDNARERMLYMAPMTFSLREVVSETPDETIPDETIPEETIPEETEPEETIPEETIPEETIPEETEPEETNPVYKPKFISVVDSYSRLLKRATFLVTSSTDVSYITVNGVRVNGTKLLGTKLFTYSVGNVKAGTVFDVVAYNAEGIAAEVKTVTTK